MAADHYYFKLEVRLLQQLLSEERTLRDFLDNVEEIQIEIVSREKIPALVKQVDDKGARKLTAKQRYILARIDGKRSVQAIIQVSPMRDIEALEILRGFLRDGIIRL